MKLITAFALLTFVACTEGNAAPPQSPSDGGNHGLRAMQMPPAYAGEQDLEGGARIDLTPHDPNDLANLRAKVQTRARELMASCE